MAHPRLRPDRILPLVLAGLAALVLVVLVVETRRVGAAEEPVAIPPPALDAADEPARATAVLAGGCFWGVQGVFQHVDGVENAVSGYTGGTVPDPAYRQVTTGTTGHAEAVRITYDPAKISYGRLLQVFFSVAHDPTQRDRQGPDIGTHYRSAIFFADARQEAVARAYIAQLDADGKWPAPIVTEVTPLDTFYPAEDYHQDYATLHPDQPYIYTYDLPKIANLKAMFPDLWRAEPRLVLPQNAL